MTAPKIAGLLGGTIPAAQATLGIVPAYPTLLPKWRAALAKMNAGIANARVLCVGDSTTFGAFSNNGADTGNLTANSYSAALAVLLRRMGYTVSENSFAGGGVVTNENRASNDGRIAITTGWVADTGGAVGGCFVKTNSAGKLSFTPLTNCDSFKVWYARTASSGTFSYDLNGGTATNVNSANAANDIQFASFTGTLGANTVNLNYVSGGYCYLAGIECWDSTKKQIIVQNAGWPTSKVSDWLIATQPYNVYNALANFAGDLNIVCLGINDWLGGVSAAAYGANLQSLITKLLTYGDVMLLTPAPSSIGSVARATQDAFIAQLYALAGANNIPLVDVYARLGSYEISNPLGLYGHIYHPNQNGYADIAQAVAGAIGRL